VEWRKLRREIGVMGYEDEMRAERSKEIKSKAEKFGAAK
jgi:hypothetical protein